MAITLNLEKSTSNLKLSLEKAGVLTPPKCQTGIAMDVSGSFADEHRDGLTTDLLARLVPWALTFDPDRKADVFAFSDDSRGVDLTGAIDEHNYSDYIAKRIFRKCSAWGGATDYAHVLTAMLTHFGWGAPQVKKAGFLGRMMGKQDQVVAGARERSLVLFVTDGENNDEQATREVLRDSEARGDQVYFLFIGINNDPGVSFRFLRELGDEFSNTGFVRISDLKGFVRMDDDALNAKLINDELVGWLKS